MLEDKNFPIYGLPEVSTVQNPAWFPSYGTYEDPFSWYVMTLRMAPLILLRKFKEMIMFQAWVEGEWESIKQDMESEALGGG